MTVRRLIKSSTQGNTHKDVWGDQNEQSFWSSLNLRKLSGVGFALLIIGLALVQFLPARAAYLQQGSLVGYWPLNETSGPTAADVSGYSRNGTYNGSPTPSTDVPTTSFPNSHSLSFNGTSDKVSTTSPFTAGQTNFTISLWINPAAINTGAYQGIIGRQDIDTEHRAPSLWIAPSDGGLHYNIFDAADSNPSYGIIPNVFTATDQWVHITWVKNGTASTFYKNGTAVSSNVPGPSTFYESDNNYNFGGIDNYFKGKLDDIRIYNRALSVAEVSQLGSGNDTAATWTGAANTVFSNPSNWDINAVPDGFTDITIPQATYSPHLTTNTQLHNLSINSSASFNLDGYNLEFANGGSFSNNGIMSLNGNETLTGFTNDTDSGSIYYKGNGSYSGLATGNTYNNLSLSSGTGTWTLNAPLQVHGTFSQWAGTINTGGYAISATQGWQQYGGTFNAEASNITASSGWTHSGGTFNSGTSTVNLAGSSFSIANNNNFYNLTYAPPSGGTLLFSAGTTQTITHTLTITGTSGHLVALKSSLPGTQWQINPSGSANLSYLNVSDSNNTSGSLLVPSNSTSGGNNTNWDFAAPTVTIPGTDAFSGGYWDDDSTPTLTFNTADSDSSQVKYRVQISKNSDFSSPVVDYTSTLASPNSLSFTVGQPAGSGSYTAGQSGQTLDDGSYYWRVMAIDDGGLESGWTVSHGGAIAFKVDTTAPSKPSASVPGGYHNAAQSVTLSSSDSGSGVSAIYYTTDGAVPTNASTKYTGAINISSDTTLKAIAYDLVGNSSGIMSEAYQIDTTKLTGGSIVSNELGTTSNITDLQVSSDEINPTVTVKLFVSHGTISMNTTTGITFYDNNGTSLGSTQPANASSLQFGSTMNNVNAALASLKYIRTDGKTGSDSLSASLIPQGSAYYPGNGHLYQYVSGPSTWADAKSAASASSKYGAGGYLATITSQGENDFILTQLKSDSWIGASDDTSTGTTEGNWIWATGPETGQQFWQGTGTGLPASGQIVGGMYNNWNNSANGDPMQEPNNSNANGENCAEFYYRPTYDGYHPNGTWNDYQCGALLGYIIEYGGLNGINPIISSKSVAITTSDTIAPGNPAISPAGGTFGSSQSVTISSTDNSGGGGIDAIYYTTNGDTPTDSSTKYTGAITVSSSKTIKAIAYDKAGNISSVTSATFIIDTTPPTTPSNVHATTGSNDTTPSWSWDNSSDGESGLANPAYTVQWSKSADFSSGVSSDSSSINSFTNLTDLADNSLWYFRVRATDGVGNNSSWSTPASLYITTTAFTGGSAVSNEQGKPAAITDLQVSSQQTNPTVYVKLYVNSGKISLGTTTGITFYNPDGSSRGSSQPANTSDLHIGGSMNNVNAALASLTYTRNSGTGSDSLSASLVDPGEVFFPGNNHLYEYFAGPLTWGQAKSAADGLDKYGAPGYLATITSQSENDFILNRLKSDSWIGASDSETEGSWKWVTGPEAGQQFWQGDGGGSVVGGRYAHWNNTKTGGSGSEPNQSGDEDCAEFYYSNNGLWNDLGCSSALGYIVEYGGLGGINPTIEAKSVAITTVTDATAPTKPGQPTVSPASPTSNNKPSLSWAASTDSGSGLANPAYTVQWSHSADFSNVIDSDTTNISSYNFASALDDGTWYFRILAADASGNSSTSAASSAQIIDTTASSAPGVPIPDSAITNNSKPTFSWAASVDSGAGLANEPYEIQWSEKSNFSSGVSSATASDPSFTLSTGLTDGTWYFRVQAQDQTGNTSAWSPVGNIEIDLTNPNSPSINPAGGSYSKPQNVTISASDNTGGSGIDTIYYTTNGDTPTISDIKYTGTTTIDTTKTIKAIAYDKAGNKSPVVTENYIFDFSQSNDGDSSNNKNNKTDAPISGSAGSSQRDIPSRTKNTNLEDTNSDSANTNNHKKYDDTIQLNYSKQKPGTNNSDSNNSSALFGFDWWRVVVLVICGGTLYYILRNKSHNQGEN